MTRDTRQRRGKNTERGVCKYLGDGVERIAGVGRRDLDGGWFAAEVKERATLPQWLTGALEQAERHARPEQLAIVVLHPLGGRHEDDIVLIRLGAFKDSFGGMDETETE